jgi:hypothetical protein
MSGASAEDYAGFGWLFDSWSQMVVSILVSAEPIFAGIVQSSGGLVSAVGALWLCLMLLNAARVGLIRGVLAGLVIFSIIVIGMRPALFSTPGRGSVEMVEIQQKPLTFVLSVHSIYAGALSNVLKNQTIAGTIIPAESATRDAVERSAAAFGDSDLARLMRDYNAQCAPDKAALAEPEHAVTRDALNAVGLLGGVLGIPDESVTVLEQAKAGFSGLWDAVSNPFAGGFSGGPAELTRALDIGAIRSNREAGIAALQKMNKSFNGGTYALPTKSHWSGVYSGAAKSTSDYLRVSDLPAGLSADMESNVTAWRGSEGKAAVISLDPRTCVEAYKLAQFAAEQAYSALQDVGTQASGGQSIGAQSGAISAGLSWQNTINRTLNGGEVADGASTAAGGISASFQMLKSWWSWLDLQTLLPAYVAGLAWLFCIVLIIGPIALLIAPLRGIEVLFSWFSLLLFPLLALIFADILAVMASLVLAGVSANHAAAASGWTGMGADLEVIRGSAMMIAAVLLPASGWLASQLAGVSLGGLGGSAGGAVATATYAAGMVGSAASMLSRAGRMASSSSDRSGTGSSTRGGGGSGGSGGSGGGGSHAGSSGGVPRNSAAPTHRPDGGSPSSRAAASRINLNPGAPANADNFGGRTPRSIKNKLKKDD